MAYSAERRAQGSHPDMASLPVPASCTADQLYCGSVINQCDARPRPTACPRLAHGLCAAPRVTTYACDKGVSTFYFHSASKGSVSFIVLHGRYAFHGWFYFGTLRTDRRPAQLRRLHLRLHLPHLRKAKPSLDRPRHAPAATAPGGNRTPAGRVKRFARSHES